MIGDDIAAALPVLRAQAESLMVEACDIDRLSSAWSEVEQKTVTVVTPVHDGIPCALDIPPATSRSLLSDEAVTSQSPVVKVSVDYADMKPDDRVTITNVGVVWVTHVPFRSNQVQRRLECRWVR